MAELGTASLRVVPDTSSLTASLSSYFGSSRFASMGKAAGVALGAGIAAGGAATALYQIGQEFDAAYDKIRIQTGATGKELRGLQRDFKAVVQDVPVDFETASTAVAGLNQRLDLTGRPLQKLTKQITELSRITGTDVEANVQSITRLFGDWSIKTRDQADTLDKLFRAGQATGIKIGDLSDLMVQFGSPLRQLGLDFDTAAAMFSRFEKEGVNIQTLMPGLRMALKNFSAPTDDLAATFDRLGISLKEGPSVALKEVFEQLEKAPSDLKANALAFEVFGARAGPDMAAAVREGRFELEDLMAEIKNGKDTIRDAGRDTMDFGEQWQMLKNDVFVALEPVARKFFGAIGDEAKRLRKILTDKDLTSGEKFEALIDELGRLAKEYGPQLAEAGAKIGTKLIEAVVDTFVNSSLLGRLFIGAAVLRYFGGAKAIKGAGTLLGKTMGRGIPGGLVIGLALGTALLAPEAFKLGKKLGEEMKRPMHQFFKWVVDTFGGVADKVLGVFTGIIGTVADFMDRLGDVPVIGAPFQQAADNLHEVEDGINGIRDAMRDVRKFRDDPLGFTRQALRDNAQDIGAVTNQLMGMGIGYERASKLVRRAGSGTNASLQRNQETLDTLGDRLGGTSEKWRGYGKDVDRTARKGNADVGKHEDAVDSALEAINGTLKRTADKAAKYADDNGKSFGRTTKASGKMAKGVGHNVQALVDGVGSGLDINRENLNKALGAFKVKEVAYTVKKAGNLVNNVVNAKQGATIVPGSGDGDIVPMHLNGQLAAWVEPGEQVSVLNRTATAAAMAWNSKHRRRPGAPNPARLKGGGALSSLMRPFDVDGAQPGFVPFMNFLNSQYGPIYVMSGLRPGSITTSGNVSNHSSGHAVDISTSESGVDMATGPGSLSGPGAARMDALHSYMARNISLPGDFLWRTFTGGNHYNHIHRGITSPEADDPRKMISYLSGLPGGANVAALKRLILKGPKGPMRSYGQGTLDRAWQGAKDYLDRYASTAQYGTGNGLQIEDLPPKLRQFNKRYPSAMFPSSAWSNLYQMPFGAVAALAEWRGTPGVTMAQVSEGEGNLRPGSRSSDNGWGLWGITSPFADGFGVDEFGGYPGMLNPVANATIMGRMYPQGWSGGSPWYGTGNVTGYDQHYSGHWLRKQGGLVPHLKSGGKPNRHSKQWYLRRQSPVYLRAMELTKQLTNWRGKLADITNEDHGPIARLDEMIGVAQAEAAMPKSPGGTETTEDEVKKQRRLWRRLLGRLEALNDLATKGRKLSRKGQKLGIDPSKRWGDLGLPPAVLDRLGGKQSIVGQFEMLENAFREQQVMASGITGKAGRILEARQALGELSPTTTGPEPIDISGLRSIIEAARYGAFDGLRGAGGKIAPGKYAITGERGPEIIHGPATVTPAGGGVNIVNEVHFDEAGVWIESAVNGVIAKRERIRHQKARQYA